MRPACELPCLIAFCIGIRRVGRRLIKGPRLDDINKHCLEEFRQHWQCLDNNNQQLWHCRRPETLLNKCVFDKLVCLVPCGLRSVTNNG